MRPEEVTDRDSFIRYLQHLQKNIRNNEFQLENNTTIGFLEAMERYTGDIQRYYDNTQLPLNADAPSWRVFADIITGATVYE